MTLPDLPDATEPEELASAILDGEATAAEQARAGEPEVAAALARLRGVAAAVGATGPVDELARERAIALALDAWGTEAATAAAAGAAGASGDELARRRQARRGVRLVGVAAAVVAALAVGGIALTSGDDDTDTSADVAAEAPAATEAAGSAGDGAESGTGGSATQSATSALTDLGAFDDLDDLVAFASGEATERAVVEEGEAFDADDGAVAGDAASEDLEESVQDGSVTAPATGAAAPSCTPPPPPGGDPVVVSTATLEGRPVTVVVAGTGDDAVVQVVDALTCELRYEGPAG
jgi:hypothetical protein